MIKKKYKGLIVALFVLVSTAHGTNLVQNSSFEVGLRGWDYNRWFAKGFYKLNETDRIMQPEIDRTIGYEGNASVKITFPSDATEMVSYELRSAIYGIETGRKYTFSAYLRSDRTAVPVTMSIARGSGLRDKFLNKQVTVTDKWERYSVSGEISSGPVAVMIILGESAKGATIWIDGAQFEEGEMTEYTSRREAEIGIAGIAPHNIYKTGEKIEPEVMIHGYMEGDGEYEVNYEVIETLAEKVVLKKKEKTKLRKETAIKKLPMELNSNRKGIYKIVGRITDSKGKEIDSCEYIYAVYNPLPVPEDFKENSIFGIHQIIMIGLGGDGKNFVQIRDGYETYVKLASFIGCRWNRDFDLAVWRAIEPEKGKFNFKNDYILDLCDKYKIRIMSNLGQEIWPHRIPRWAVGDETDGQEKLRPDVPREHFLLPKIDDWYHYVYETVKHYKGRVNHWEIFNEPNLYILDPKKYANLLKAAYEAAKAADPEAKIVGCCVTEGYHHDKLTSEYVKGVLDAVGPKFDILSMHVYPGLVTIVPEAGGVSLDKAIEAQKEVLRQYGVKDPVIWDTESSIETSTYYTRMSPYGVWNRCPNATWDGKNPESDQVKGASYIARKFLIYKANNVKWDHFILGPDINTTYGGSASLLEYDTTPKLGYVVYGTLVSVFEDAKPVRKIVVSDNVYGYLFEKENRYIMTLCNTEDKKGVIVLHLSREKLEVMDMAGNPVEVKEEAECVSLPISGAPVYAFIPKEISAEKIASVFEAGEILGMVPYKMGLELAQDPKSGKPSVAVEVKNTSTQDVTAELQLVGCPKDWQVEKKLKVGPIKKGESQVSYVVVNNIGKQDAPVKLRLMARIGNEIIEAIREIRKVLGMPRVKAQIKIDGTVAEGEWGQAEEMELDKKEQVVVGDKEKWAGAKDLSGTIYTLWDEKNLYVAGKVKCSHFIQKKRETEINDICTSTCLELFLSLNPMTAIWNPLRKESDYQLLFTPKTKDNPSYYSLGIRGPGETIKLTGIETASRQVDGGYEMEIKIPWSNFEGFKPEAGKVIGFDAAIDGTNEKGDREYQMVWAGTSENCKDVSLFAKVILKGK